MKSIILTAICCTFFLGLSAQTEVLRTLGGRAKSKVQQQDFNSTRTNKEKLDGNRKRSTSAPAAPPATESTTPEEGAQEGERTQTNPAISSSGNTKYSDVYTFGQKVTYEMESPGQDGKQVVTYYYGDNAMMTVFEDNAMCAITDFENQAMITINENEKSAMAMSMAWADKMNPQQKESSEEANVTKTGKKKKILGYTCEEYIIEDDQVKSVCWISPEVTVNYADAMAAMMKGNPGADKVGQGLMMEATTYDKKGELEMHMILTEYTLETLVKTMSDYAVTAL